MIKERKGKKSVIKRLKIYFSDYIFLFKRFILDSFVTHI